MTIEFTWRADVTKQYLVVQCWSEGSGTLTQRRQVLRQRRVSQAVWTLHSGSGSINVCFQLCPLLVRQRSLLRTQLTCAGEPSAPNGFASLLKRSIWVSVRQSQFLPNLHVLQSVDQHHVS